MLSIRSLLPLALAWPSTLVCAAPANPVAADPIDNESATRLESMVVTAHRLPTGAPVLPVRTVQLDNTPPIGMQTFRSLPSFAISQSGSLGSLTQVRARGAEANHLLVLLDGVDVMDLTADSGFNFGNLSLAGISRVEYLPGAQSAIWGNHALAGVLHLSTEPTERVRQVHFESGSYDTRQGSLQLADRRDDYYYNVSVSDFSTDGTNTARQGNERDGYANQTWLLAAGLHREAWSLRTLTRRTRTRADFDPTPFPLYLPVDGDRVNRHDETLALVGLDLRGTERNWLQRFNVSVFDTANTTRSDDVRTAATDGRRWQLSSSTWLPLSARQELQLLLEHRHERFEQRGEAGFFGDPNQRQKLETSSAGLEYILRPGPRWRLSASGRHDRNRAFSDSESLRLGASFQWRDDTLLWVTAGTGIKLPSFVERFGFTPDSFIGNPDLDPERNRHLSIGADHQRGPWNHTLSLFRDRLEREINGFAFDPDQGGFTAVNEDGTSRREGLEWTSAFGWSTGAARIGGNLLNARENDGSREVRRPRRQAFVTFDQSWRAFRFDAGAFYVDPQSDRDFATWPATTVTLDRYTLIHAQLRYVLRPGVELGLRGNNLRNEAYEDILGYRAPGRAWYLNLGVAF